MLPVYFAILFFILPVDDSHHFCRTHDKRLYRDILDSVCDKARFVFLLCVVCSHFVEDYTLVIGRCFVGLDVEKFYSVFTIALIMSEIFCTKS